MILMGSSTQQHFFSLCSTHLRSLPIFIALTKDYDGEQLVRCANKAVMVAAILFIIFVLIGTNLLGIFSVTIQGFKVAGGLVPQINVHGDNIRNEHSNVPGDLKMSHGS